LIDAALMECLTGSANESGRCEMIQLLSGGYQDKNRDVTKIASGDADRMIRGNGRAYCG
jgi:hypothetical protein